MKYKAFLVPEEKLVDVKQTKDGYSLPYFNNLEFESSSSDWKEWEKDVKVVKLRVVDSAKDKIAVEKWDWDIESNKKALLKINYSPLRPRAMAYNKLDETVKKSQTKEEKDISIATIALILAILVVGASIIYGYWSKQSQTRDTETQAAAIIEAANLARTQNCIINFTTNTLNDLCKGYVDSGGGY